MRRDASPAIALGIALASLPGCKRSETAERGKTGRGSALGTEAEVRRAYETATGRSLAEHACIVHPTSFSALVVVGGFAHDRGCMLEGMFIDGNWVDDSDSARALAAHGWGSVHPEQRQALARAWVTEVMGAFGSEMQEQTSAAFELEDTPAFVPPELTAQGGAIVFDAWVGMPSGMVHESEYRHLRYTFDEAGNVSIASLERFVVPGDRL